MTRNEKVKFLIKAADMFDREGQFELANIADAIIKEEATRPEEELDLEIPQEEYDVLRKIYEALGQSFK